MPGCSSRSASFFSSRSTTSACSSWVGRLPVAKLVVFPPFAPPVVAFAFAMLAGIGVQVLWNRDLRVRRFLTLLASALTRAGRSPAHGRSLARDQLPTDAREWSGAQAQLFAVLAIAAVVLASRLGRRWAAWLLAGVDRRRALRARAVRHLREESRPIPRSRLDAARSNCSGHPSLTRVCSGSTASCTRTLRLRSACRTSARSTRSTSARYWRYVQDVHPAGRCHDRFHG